MNDRKNVVTQKVSELAAEQAGVDVAQVTPATHFVDDLNYDSLDVMEFAMAVEDEFEVSVPDDKVDEIRTVGAAIDFVMEQTAGRAEHE